MIVIKVWMDGNAKQYPPIIEVPNAEQAVLLGDIDARRDSAKAMLEAPDEAAMAAMSTAMSRATLRARSTTALAVVKSARPPRRRCCR